MKPHILLTFDLEEFDLPPEYGCPVSDADQMNITCEGMQRLRSVLAENNIPATFFTTSFFADKNRELVRSLSEAHEIASHSKNHSEFRDTDPHDSKAEIEEITGKKIHGFRMPRFGKTDLSLINDAGYDYDSSINPTLIPGRYNNLFASRSVYRDRDSGLTEVPVSVSTFIRFPLFWLSFKNIPLSMYLHMCKAAIRKDSYLHLYFHPWEFAELDSFKIPGYIKNPSGEVLKGRFRKLIAELGKENDFSTVYGFLESKGFPGKDVS